MQRVSSSSPVPGGSRIEGAGFKQSHMGYWHRFHNSWYILPKGCQEFVTSSRTALTPPAVPTDLFRFDGRGQTEPLGALLEPLLVLWHRAGRPTWGHHSDSEPLSSPLGLLCLCHLTGGGLLGGGRGTDHGGRGFCRLHLWRCGALASVLRLRL